MSRTLCPRIISTLAAVVAAAALYGPPLRAADDVLATPPGDDVRARALEWTAAQKVTDDKVIERVGAVWSGVSASVPSREILDRVIETFRLVDLDTRRFLDACNLVRPRLVPPDPGPLLGKQAGSEFYRANLKLYFARHLTQRNMYDEALEIFKTLDPATVVDPASCLFYRAVCEHQLLKKTDGLATIDRLLSGTQRPPESYTMVAKLMQRDLQETEEETLGSVSRLMRDSERRLDLGRGGQKVQKVQDEIVATLDDLIKKAEQQQSGGGGSGSGQNNSNQSGSPAEDSTLKGATAPGEVDQKELKKQGGWGSLPPKEEARAKNLLNKEFPVHYQQAVEQYFKKLANRRAPAEREP